MSRRRRRNPYGWFPITVEAYTLVLVFLVMAFPVGQLEPWFPVLLAPAALFVFVRLVAAIAVVKGGRL